MEMWELFLKGLAKTFEEFAQKMIERGKEEGIQSESRRSHSGYSRSYKESPTPKASKGESAGIHDIEKLQESILEIIKRSSDGITMKNIASGLKVQWHFLRVPMRQLQMEGRIIKKNLKYYLADSENADTEPERKDTVTEPETYDIDYDQPMFNFFKEVVTEEKPDEPEVSKQKTSTSKTVESSKTATESDEKEKTSAPRRRIVDASQLKDKPKAGPELSKEEIREREILRFRVLTALRGRPEGLSKGNIALIVGEKLERVEPVLTDLQKEAKVVQKEKDTFRLP